MDWFRKSKALIYIIISVLLQHLYNAHTGYSGGGFAVLFFTGFTVLDNDINIIRSKKDNEKRDQE